jgi:hypothetical protein
MDEVLRGVIPAESLEVLVEKIRLSELYQEGSALDLIMKRLLYLNGLEGISVFFVISREDEDQEWRSNLTDLL